MSVPVLHETDVEESDLPGRYLRWVVAPNGLNAAHCSACVIRVAPGNKVRPAHSHPQGEKVIYIIRGYGRVLVAGEVASVREGSVVRFPQGAVPMLHNTGTEEMKVVCFFAPIRRTFRRAIRGGKFVERKNRGGHWRRQWDRTRGRSRAARRRV